MSIRVCRTLAILTLALTAALSGEERTPWVHRFSFWEELKLDKNEKTILLQGVLNGFFVGASGGFCRDNSRALPFLTSSCFERITVEQAIAMVDKYYKDHPEQWNLPLGDGIIRAITVKGGPCEGMFWEDQQVPSRKSKQ